MVSLQSLLTGLPPNSVGFSSWEAFSEHAELAENVTTLPEKLSEEGYKTHRKHGDIPYDHIYRGFDETSWESVNKSFGKDEFYWLLLYDPHYPYAPSSENRKWDNLSMNRTQLSNAGRQKESLNLSQSEITNLYDGSIREADSTVGELKDSLRKQGLYDDSLIIITSDHGEAFGERGLYYHAKKPFKDQTHVPLIVKFPENKYAGREVEKPVSLIEIVPTIYDLLDIQASSLYGDSLMSEKDNYPVVSARTTDKDWAVNSGKGSYLLQNVREHCVRNRSPVVIRKNVTESGSGDTEDKLRKELCSAYKWGEDHNYPPQPKNITPEMRQQLKEMGYLQ